MTKRPGKNKRKQNGRGRGQAKNLAQMNQAQNNSKQICPESLKDNGDNGQKDIREESAGKKKEWTRGEIIAVVTLIVTFLGVAVAVVMPFWQQKGDTDIYYAGQPVELSYSNSRYRAGQEFFNDGEFDKALEMFEQAMGEYEGQSVADVNLARIQYAMGVTYKYKGEYEAAIENYTIAIGTLKSLEEAEESDDIKKDIKEDIKYELGYVHYLRGTAYVDSHQLEKGRIDLNACADAVGYFKGGAGVEKWYDLASVYNAFGELFFASAYSERSPYDTGEVLGYTYQDAYDAYNAALELKGVRKVFEDDGKILTYLGDQIKVFDQLGTYSMPEQDEEGKINFWEFLDVIESSWYEISFIDAEAADILLNRAGVVLCMGYYDAALYDCETALKIYDMIGPSVRSKVADAYFMISQIMLEQSAMGDGVLTDEAKKQFVEYMTIGVEYNEKWLGQSFATARLYESQGFAYLLDAQWDNAAGAFGEAKRIFGDLDLMAEAEKEEEYIEMANVLKAEGEDGEWRMERVR